MLASAERSEESLLGQEHDAMLREALSRPGVREVMEIYEHARRQASPWFAAHWALARGTEGPTTTDHTNSDAPAGAVNANLRPLHNFRRPVGSRFRGNDGALG